MLNLLNIWVLSVYVVTSLYPQAESHFRDGILRHQTPGLTLLSPKNEYMDHNILQSIYIYDHI